MCLSEPIELYTQNGCNLFSCDAAIKLILKGKKDDILVTEVTELRSKVRSPWENVTSPRLHRSSSKLAIAQNVADKEGLSPIWLSLLICEMDMINPILRQGNEGYWCKVSNSET